MDERAGYESLLPRMLIGEELRKKLLRVPEYNEKVSGLDAGSRLLKLTEIYSVFSTFFRNFNRVKKFSLLHGLFLVHLL